MVFSSWFFCIISYCELENQIWQMWLLWKNIWLERLSWMLFSIFSKIQTQKGPGMPSMAHLNSFFPSWTLSICLLRSVVRGNVAEQTVHFKRPLPFMNNFTILLRSAFRENVEELMAHYLKMASSIHEPYQYVSWDLYLEKMLKNTF